mgnify:CR=1 FL=1
MKNETERLNLRQKYRNDVNPVLAEKQISKDIYTFTDEYVFLLEEQLVEKIEVSNRRELLIATLHGWQDYKGQGISIEDYVDEIESNL